MIFLAEVRIIRILRDRRRMPSDARSGGIGDLVAAFRWRCGVWPFINDWSVSNGNIRSQTHDVGNCGFDDYEATSQRRIPDGSMRRVRLWIGSCRRKTNMAHG
ncbi:MAG: hypothetical protein F4Z55_00805, partial [Boseongicola sp. SB0667_bin_21]|nr:hypothetical protein [Boseongicola sp. SB0667_bin_21]